MEPVNAHPTCASGKRCVIAVGASGAHLSSMCPLPYCIPCDRLRQKKFADAQKQRNATQA